MKYRAVIFDLFGTLVDDLLGPENDAVFVQIASVLDIQNDDFRQMWSNTVYERLTGGFRSVEANILHICQELGVQPKEVVVKLAAQMRQDYNRRILTTPRLGSVEVLLRLKRWGHKTGLISDCTPDTPVIWPETPLAPLFDVSVFSCSVHLKKPDHRIYEYAIERLGIQSKDCLYVGNGGSDELRGAFEAGMYPVMITQSANNPSSYYIDSQWEGDSISFLKDVLTLVR